MPSASRGRRRQGHTFYITALLLSLLAVYSYVHSIGLRHDRESTLVARALPADQEECRHVHRFQDQCAFVRANCEDEDAGLFSYLQFYYCDMANAKSVAFTLIILWVSLLFSTIGIAASDFLCINLSTIATVLGMSESLTGVTFLAFGNGSPDVFSTFAAMSTNSGSLAVGELMGAAGFITTVVAGSMALVKPFQVARKSFIRDVGFFTVAAAFSLVFLADGSLRLWECIAMIGFYLFYVVFVVAWHWWLTRRRQRRIKEVTARSHLHIPDTQELDMPPVEIDEEAAPAGERSALLRAESSDTIPTMLLTPGTPAWKVEDVDDDDETRDRYLAELQSNMRVSRAGRHERRNTMTPIRPSLIGALEFRSVLSALERRSTSSQPIGLRRYSDAALQNVAEENSTLSASGIVPNRQSMSGEDLDNGPSHTHTRAVSTNDAVGLHLGQDLLKFDEVPENAILTAASTPNVRPMQSAGRQELTRNILRSANRPSSQSPKLLLSPADGSPSHELTLPGGRSDHLAPPAVTTSFRRPDWDEAAGNGVHSPLLSPGLGPAHGSTRSDSGSNGVPVLGTPHPDHKRSRLYQTYDSYRDSPETGSLVSRSRSSSIIRLPASALPIEANQDFALQQHDDGEMRRWKWWPYTYLPAPQIIASTFFPTLYGWHDKTWIDKLLGIATAPSVLFLTITLPVVESSEEDSDLDARLSPGKDHNTSTLVPDTPSLEPVESTPHPHNLNRTSTDPNKLTPTDTSTLNSNPRGWNRWLVVLQLFTAPLFVAIILWANLDESHSIRLLGILIVSSIAFSLICVFSLLATTTANHPPHFRPVLCFLGFLVAIAWISTIAGEVVGVLKTIGVVLNMSDAILGLTIFAVGNSLGDLVADITVARLGYPVMALSACFGGPMLNILLGIGISGTYITVRKGISAHKKHPQKEIKYKPFDIDVSTTLIISGITLLVTLVGLMIVVPLNGWRMDRKIGWGLIGLWCLSAIGNVIVEVTGFGETAFAV